MTFEARAGHTYAVHGALGPARGRWHTWIVDQATGQRVRLAPIPPPPVPSPPARRLAVAPGPVVTARQPDEIAALVRGMPRPPAPGGPEVEVPEVPLLRANQALREWLDKPRHRALAVGHPSRCGYSYRTHTFRSREAAADAAVRACLTRVRQFGPHVAEPCGCRLAIVDEVLLVEPDELPPGEWLPGVLLVRAGDRVDRVDGMVQASGFPGTNLPFTFFDAHGTEVCRGLYSLTMGAAVRGAGDFASECRLRGRALSGVGSLDAKGLLSGEPTGVGRATLDDGGELLFLFGVNAADEARRSGFGP